MKNRNPPANKKTIPAIQMALGSWGEEPQTIRTNPKVKTKPAVQQQNSPKLKYLFGVFFVKYGWLRWWYAAEFMEDDVRVLMIRWKLMSVNESFQWRSDVPCLKTVNWLALREESVGVKEDSQEREFFVNVVSRKSVSSFKNPWRAYSRTFPDQGHRVLQTVKSFKKESSREIVIFSYNILVSIDIKSGNY